jgi:hypothetical protein
MTCYRFTSRSPFSYRTVLRPMPMALRRRWWSMRWRYPEPRVAIGRMHVVAGRRA